MKKEKTVADLAEKYNIRPAYIIVLEQRILDLEKKVENLENDVKALTLNSFQDPYAYCGRALDEFLVNRIKEY